MPVVAPAAGAAGAGGCGAVTLVAMSTLIATAAAAIPAGASDRANLLNRFKVICPVQPLSQKYIRFRLTQISSRNPAVPPTEGRIAIVTDAGWDAVDAAASARKCVRRAVSRERATACRRTAHVPPSLKLRRTGSKEPGEAFGVDGRCGRRSRVVLASVADVKLAEASRPDRA